MKCKKCGYDFDGVFCPECGTKNTNQSNEKGVGEDAAGTEKKINRKAIISLILGILSWVGIITVIIPIVGGIWSIADGIKALKGKTKYKKSAITGIVLSVAVLSCIVFAVVQSGSDAATTVDTKTENSVVVQETETTSEEETELESEQETVSSENNEQNTNNEDDDLKQYEAILNSYDVSIYIYENEEYMEKYQYDTEVYIDGQPFLGAEFESGIHISTVLEEGTHEIWLTKTTNNKERESNKIKFEVSPLYTNHLEIEATLENQKEFSLSTAVENNELYQGYETEHYNGVEIVRTSNGKQIYYTVEFLIDNTQFIGNASIMETDWIDSVKVARGDKAAAPDAPDVENYEFVGWSEDISDIKSNLTVYAQYELREEDCYSEYLGKYEYRTTDYDSGEEYVCTWEINRITNVGIYFSLNFLDRDLGEEMIVTDEFAQWDSEGSTAYWAYEEFEENSNEWGDEEGGKEYYLVLSLYEYDGKIAVSIADRIGNTNAEDQYGRRYEKVY